MNSKRQGPGSESGFQEVDPLLAQLLGGAAGAATGAAIDDENRMRGAVLGGLGGAAIPAVAQRIAQGAPHATPEGFRGAVDQIINTIPQALRFNYLTSPNLINNALVAPYAAGVLKGLELHLAGDPRGAIILEQMSPVNWGRMYNDSIGPAQQLIQEAERGGGQSFAEASTPLGRLFAAPGVGMSAGDLATRTIMMNAGLTEAEARAATLTADPEFKFLKSLLDAQRSGGAAMQILFPFARTVLNVFEQALMKAPGLGIITQALRENPDPWRAQLAQQAVGLGVMGAGGLAGYANSDAESPTTAKFFRSMATNAGGPYAGLAGIGYAMGNSLARGDSPRMALNKGVTTGIQELPLPSADIPIGWKTFILGNARGEHPLPPGTFPGQNYLKDVDFSATPQSRYQRPPR
jgi:hypothetical protein